MLILAFLAHALLPEAIVTPPMRHVCRGVDVPTEPVSLGADGATVPVFGCATRVTVTCDAPFAAVVPRSFLVPGDALRVGAAIAPEAGTRAECRLTSDQGPATIELVQR